MRLRLAALIAPILAVLLLGGWWFIEHRRDVIEREHAIAISRAAEEPGVLIPDPALSPGVIEIDLVPAGPSIELPEPATIRFGQQTRHWSPGRRASFEAMTGARNERISVLGDYLVESVRVDVPTSKTGAQVALRAIPIDPPMLGPTTEKQLEIDNSDPNDIIVVWKQGRVVVSETKVPRASGRAAHAAFIQKEWTMQGSHRDPMDRRFDWAVVRFGAEQIFLDIFPLVDAILATQRTVKLPDGGTDSVPAFRISLQPAPRRPPARPDLDERMPRPAPY